MVGCEKVKFFHVMYCVDGIDHMQQFFLDPWMNVDVGVLS